MLICLHRTAVDVSDLNDPNPLPDDSRHALRRDALHQRDMAGQQGDPSAGGVPHAAGRQARRRRSALISLIVLTACMLPPCQARSATQTPLLAPYQTQLFNLLMTGKPYPYLFRAITGIRLEMSGMFADTGDPL